MAYERANNLKNKGEGLDVFIENKIKMLQRQLAVRNAEYETRFQQLVLENNISLEEQLAYRQEQLKKVFDDPEEKKRIKLEIASLKDRIEVKNFTDNYIQRLAELEGGMMGVESMISWLKSRREATKDSNIQEMIDKALVDYERRRFEIAKQALENQTRYALEDRSESVINEQINRISQARSAALLAGNNDLVTTYDLYLQSLKKALSENSILKAIGDMAAATMGGQYSAVRTLDIYNDKIANAPDSGSITIGNITYNSPREFWLTKRNAYLADVGSNGFFGRLSNEKEDYLKTLQSSKLLNENTIRQQINEFDLLASRPELQDFNVYLNNVKQLTLQKAIDMKTQDIINRYSIDYDINNALNELNQYKALGANTETAYTKILLKAAEIKSDQLSNIFQFAENIRRSNPSISPEEAINQAVKAGAGLTLSPVQLVSKTEKELATEAAKGAQTSSFITDPRTTVGNQSQIQPAPPPTVPQVIDLSDKYGIVGQTVYRKSDNKPFSTPQEFFKDAGINTFQNVKFDTNFKPPVAGSSQLNQTPPSPSPITYKVVPGDTLSAIAQRLLGDSRRYTEIAKLNNLANPNLIKPGQELIIPGK